MHRKRETTMKTSAILCSILAGTLGFGSLASAQDWNGGRRDRDNRVEQRQDGQERREDRAERRDDRQQDRRNDRRDDRQQDRRDDRSFRQGYDAGNRQQPYYVQQQPNHAYGQPGYRQGPRFQRGAYLPYEYRNRGYYVNDWRAHRGLYAPPHGHQWVQVGPDFVLVALATGIIASLLTQ
jgi:Ni/Co efflux regulator RcnB